MNACVARTVLYTKLKGDGYFSCPADTDTDRQEPFERMFTCVSLSRGSCVACCETPQPFVASRASRCAAVDKSTRKLSKDCVCSVCGLTEICAPYARLVGTCMLDFALDARRTGVCKRSAQHAVYRQLTVGRQGWRTLQT